MAGYVALLFVVIVLFANAGIFGDGWDTAHDEHQNERIEALETAVASR